MSLVINILFALFYCIALSGIGFLAGKHLFKTESGFFESFFTGCAIFIPILFLFGISGIFNFFFFVVLLLLLLCFVIPGRSLLMRVKIKFEISYIILLALLVGILIVNALASLSPPIKDDTMFYNLGVPRLWIEYGNIDFIPTIPLSASALNSELLLTPLMAVSNPEAAQFFVFLIAVSAMFMTARILHRHFAVNQWLALILLGTVSAYIAISTNAKNDFLCVGFAALAFLYYFDFIQLRKFKYIVLAGVSAGMAAGTKTNALLLLATLPLVMIISRDGFKPLLAFSITALALASPWYIKALVETGNPVFPFYDSLFNSPYWHTVFDTYNQATYVDMDNKSIINFLTSPLRQVYTPDIFRARLGPVPFMFLPLLLALKSIPVLIRRSLWILGLFYLLWYLVLPNSRYLFPVLPLLIVVAAFILDKIFRSSRLIKIVTIAGICSLLVFSLVRSTRDGKNRIGVTVGFTDKQSFLKNESVLDPNKASTAIYRKALPYYEAWEYLNNNSASDSQVGILCSNWDRADGFYLERNFLYLNPSEQVVVDFTESSQYIKQALVNNSLNYILVDKKIIAEFSAGSSFAGAGGFDILSRGVRYFLDIIEDSGQLEYSDDRYQLYRMGY